MFNTKKVKRFYKITTLDWIFGISIMFGLAIVLNKYTFESLTGFLVFLTIFNSFVVFGGLLPNWTLILNIVVLTIIIYSETKQKRGID